MKNNLVFVYGTLRREGSNPIEQFADAEFVGNATVPGRIYDLGWYPGFRFTSDYNDTSEVIGEVYKVDQLGLERLDAYEGAPYLYQRKNTLARLESGEDVPVFIYEFNDIPAETQLMPSGDFLKHEERHL